MSVVRSEFLTDDPAALNDYSAALHRCFAPAPASAAMQAVYAQIEAVGHEVRIAEPHLTRAQANAKVRHVRPDLVARYRAAMAASAPPPRRAPLAVNIVCPKHPQSEWSVAGVWLIDGHLFFESRVHERARKDPKLPRTMTERGSRIRRLVRVLIDSPIIDPQLPLELSCKMHWRELAPVTVEEMRARLAWDSARVSPITPRRDWPVKILARPRGGPSARRSSRERAPLRLKTRTD